MPPVAGHTEGGEPNSGYAIDDVATLCRYLQVHVLCSDAVVELSRIQSDPRYYGVQSGGTMRLLVVWVDTACFTIRRLCDAKLPTEPAVHHLINNVCLALAFLMGVQSGSLAWDGGGHQRSYVTGIFDSQAVHEGLPKSIVQLMRLIFEPRGALDSVQVNANGAGYPDDDGGGGGDVGSPGVVVDMGSSPVMSLPGMLPDGRDSPSGYGGYGAAPSDDEGLPRAAIVLLARTLCGFSSRAQNRLVLLAAGVPSCLCTLLVKITREPASYSPPSHSYTPDDVHVTLMRERETRQYVSAVAALCLDGLSHYLQDASEYLHNGFLQPNAPGTLSLTQTRPMPGEYDINIRLETRIYLPSSDANPASSLLVPQTHQTLSRLCWSCFRAPP